jgi:outer membrane lipopolysaccharide assembly protein LptE/RlpB
MTFALVPLATPADVSTLEGNACDFYLKATTRVESKLLTSMPATRNYKASIHEYMKKELRDPGIPSIAKVEPEPMI